jgi:uncharacterized cupredoxin-like copper-binding protein
LEVYYVRRVEKAGVFQPMPGNFSEGRKDAKEAKRRSALVRKLALLAAGLSFFTVTTASYAADHSLAASAVGGLKLSSQPFQNETADPGRSSDSSPGQGSPLAAPTIASSAAPTIALADEPEPAKIQVELWDKPSGGMGITLSTSEVKAGEVEFDVTNTSHDLRHEFLITHREIAPPYDDTSGQVVERKLAGLVGVEDLEPGQQTTMLLHLTPGQYTAFCNEPGHYKAGMVHTFEVKF